MYCRNSEINQLHILFTIHTLKHDIFRLEVAVNDASPVRGCERLSNLADDFRDALKLHSSLSHDRAQVLAGDILHNKIRPPVWQRADIERAHHTWMVNP